MVDGIAKSDLVKQLTPTIEQLIAKSLEYYKAGYSVAIENNVFNEWGSKNFNAMKRLEGSSLSFKEAVPLTDIVKYKISNLLD